MKRIKSAKVGRDWVPSTDVLPQTSAVIWYQYQPSTRRPRRCKLELRSRGASMTAGLLPFWSALNCSHALVSTCSSDTKVEIYLNIESASLSVSLESLSSFSRQTLLTVDTSTTCTLKETAALLRTQVYSDDIRVRSPTIVDYARTTRVADG